MALLVKIEIIDWEKTACQRNDLPVLPGRLFWHTQKIRLDQKADATIGESSETSRFRRALEGEPLKADQVCAAPSTDKISPVT